LLPLGNKAKAKAPAVSISAAPGGWSETIAALRLLNGDETTPAALLAPHQQCVVERCAQYPPVIPRTAANNRCRDLYLTYNNKTLESRSAPALRCV